MTTDDNIFIARSFRLTSWFNTFHSIDFHIEMSSSIALLLSDIEIFKHQGHLDWAIYILDWIVFAMARWY